MAIPAALLIVGIAGVTRELVLLTLFAMVLVAFLLGLVGWKSGAGKAAVIGSGCLFLLALTFLAAAFVEGVTRIHRDFGGWPSSVRVPLGGVVDVTKHPRGPWIARLPQGDVELVAISRHPSTDQPWWRPDGSPYTEGPFDIARDATIMRGETYVVVFRQHGVPNDAAFDVKVGPSGSAIDTLTRPSRDGLALAGYRTVLVALSLRAQTQSLQVGVPTGPWKTVEEVSAEARTERSTVMLHEYPEGSQVRMVAVDHYGNEHPLSSLPGIGPTGEAVMIIRLPAMNVRVFRRQARPYHWVEFRNVALQPSGQPLKSDSPAGHGENSDKVGPTASVARLKLESAERQLRVIESQYKAGAVLAPEFYEAQLARDLAAAELKGDPVEAAHARLRCAEETFSFYETKYKAGFKTELDYEKAKLARDVAAAELKKLEEAKKSK